MAPQSAKQLGLYALMMMAVVSVDSLRNIPIAAQYGLSLVSFYLIAGITFFAPLAWITAKLAVVYPKTGGSYVWIREAFGHRWGHAALGLQWIYNMIWYPTIFAFITVTIAQVFLPHYEHNTWFILGLSLGLFVILTATHTQGIRMASWMSVFSAIIGTLLPMSLIIVFSVYWLLSGRSSATPITWEGLVPSHYDLKNLAYFSNILFSVMGLEVVAMHAANVKNPKRTFPIALWISAMMILLTLIGSSLGLCIIMPAHKIGLINGLMDTLTVFFAQYGFTHPQMLIGICIIIGGVGIASSWMLSLARGLHVSFCAMDGPQWLRELNTQGMPVRVLWFQALIFTLLLLVFLLFDNINSSYWLLSAMTAQCALIYYVILFCAAYRLLVRQYPNRALRYKFVVGLACGVCGVGIMVACIPPG